MALFLNEAEVTDLVTMEETLTVLEDAFRRLGHGQVQNSPRVHPSTGPVSLQVMPAAANGIGAALKAYTNSEAGLRFVVLLWDPHTGDLLAMMEADHMGAVRTGAASGVATEYLARQDATTLGVFGSGHQSFTQVQAVCAVRSIERVTVYSPTPAHRETLAQRIKTELPTEALAVDEPRRAADADVICTITNSPEPVVLRDWVKPGTHINAAGAHRPQASELEGSLVSEAKVFLDDREQAHIECGELLQIESFDPGVWSRATELAEVVAGKASGRTHNDEITLFKSLGIAAEDLFTARLVYDNAVARGLGTELPVTAL